MKTLTLTLAASLTLGFATAPEPVSARPHYSDWNGLRLCTKADRTDPTQPKNGTPIKLRTACKSREVAIGQLLPKEGYHSIENNYETPAARDAASGMAWHISPANTERSLKDQESHLAELNGLSWSPAGGTPIEPNARCLVDGCNLELPTLHQLAKLAHACSEISTRVIDPMGDHYEYQGEPAAVCSALWPDPKQGQPGNCAWSRTSDSSAPETRAFAVCLEEQQSTKRVIAIIAIAAMTKDSAIRTAAVSPFATVEFWIAPSLEAAGR